MATVYSLDPAGEAPAGGEAMPDSELASILQQHEAQSVGYYEDDVAGEQERALNYYYRRMDDLKAAEGTSTAVDGTVAIVIENALAAILKPFVSADETVSFAPRGPEDVDQAEQATEYVNYIFNCDNPGFSILHDWFKEALLLKLGIVKYWWEEEERFEGQEIQVPDEMSLAAIGDTLVDYTETEAGFIARVGQIVQDGRVKVETIPNEEFRISPFTRSIDTAEYAAHVPSNIRRTDLLEMGFDPDIVDSLPAYATDGLETSRRSARYDDEDSVGSLDMGGVHKPMDRIAVKDEYVRIDFDGDGIAEMRRVVRVNDVILLNEKVEDNPFALLCPVPMPHKVYGQSLADQTMDLQRIATVLTRQTLDNLYKTNNPRPVIGDRAINTDGSTQDSLADNAPGAAILVNDPTAFSFEAPEFFAEKSFLMLDYIQQQQEERTGVSRSGQGLDTNALKKSGQMTATEIAMISSGKNARVELIARIFAETGVKRLFKGILRLVVRHQPKARVIRLRNKWVEVDPRDWDVDMDLEIAVGLGIGEKTEQIAQADSVLTTMAELAQSPYASLVSIENVHSAVKRKYHAAGIKNVDEYLSDPAEAGPQEEKPDPEMAKVQAEAEMQAAKLQGEQQMQAAKLQMQQEEAALKIQLSREQAAAEAQLARDKAAAEMELAREKFAFEQEMAAQRQVFEEQQAARNADRADREAEAKMSKNRAGGDLDK